MSDYDVALATMDDDGFGCAITSDPEPGEWWATGERLGHERHHWAQHPAQCRLCAHEVRPAV
jgi:hypothetical protein